MVRLKRYLTAGLMVWVPLGVTFVIIEAAVEFMDRLLLVLPAAYQPNHWLGFDIPGLGAALVALLVLVTGAVAANILGQRVVGVGEAVLARIPLVRSIYTGVKQLLESLVASNGNSFRKVVLVEYPRAGSWTVAFLTGEGPAEASILTGEDLVNVFVPTTPNPTSGFFLMIPRKDAVELAMSVDEALRMILSMGMVVPAAPRGAEQITHRATA
ncbi:MAG: DUF502 domain-containing protein [Gammaproteobacteria bacterium]|nr:DUF502 domain-containing protein [Gammaproteobacteria bacterium]